METKLCRLCGKLTDNYVNIFKTEGFKSKVETCLPVVLCQHTLLPDTVCKQCQESIDIFYAFMKNCLQSIIILEKQLDVTDSCLKSRRKSDKGVSVHLKPITSETAVQTNCEELSSKCDKLREHISEAKQLLTCKVPEYPLVDYEVSDESNTDPSGFGRQFFDNQENRILKEIAEKISLKRKGDEILPLKPKICKYDSSRRKTRPPKRIEVAPVVEISEDAWVSGDAVHKNGECVEAGSFENSQEDQKLPLFQLPQTCFLCDSSFENAAVLATHVFELHGIDMAQVIASGVGPADTKKALPKLVKINNKKNKPDKQETIHNDNIENFICPTCQSVHRTESDLHNHIHQYHPHKLALACGLCKHLPSTYSDLTSHLENCLLEFPPQSRYSCLICRFNDDNVKTVENHVSIHQFILENCKKANKMFDPSDYVAVNESCAKVYACDECSEGFGSFKEFSAHRRAQHQIFHCDLCGKFYGRNSHLWKHVNRLHKGNPIVTCQICYKTSASKYHLAVHFGKIHGVKNAQNDDFMSKKFEGFDFQSVKQSFLRQELLRTSTSDETSEEPEEKRSLPKEIDTSSKVYTNIITNYTPPTNDGEFKCPKCTKGFHKKNLLKKHKKNCRPRLQKDLLTRCKSCSRIFKDRQSLTKHLINYHTEYNCEICDQKFQSKCEIIAHIRFGHPDCDELICKCGAILRTRKEFKTHKSDHKNSFICYFCGDNLASTVRLKMHVLSLHRTILSLSCGVCLKLFETQHILRDHVRLAHKERLMKQNTCTVCGKTYATRWKAYDHMNKSHGKIFKACKECLNVFTSLDELESHYKTTHYEKPKCESEESPISDNEEYNNKSILEKPLTKKKLINTTSIENSSKRTVYENGDDPALCEICLKTWPAKKHLWQHYIRCHKTVAATVCGICLKANDSYENLQEHLQERHSNLLHGQGYGSNFICRICGRYHNASSKLKLHMAIHENFEWSMIERFEKRTQPVEELEIKSEEINFESLIEEVEESDTDHSKSSQSSERSEDVSDDDDSEFLKNEMVMTEGDTSNSSFREIKQEDMSIDDEEEKLTSAIRSICYEQKFKEDVEIEMDFSEIQVQALNSHEIQTAVDSIL